MRALLSRIVDWLVRNRSSLPGWLNRLMEAPARKPDGFVGRLTMRVLGGGDAPITTVPAAEIRVLIAPTNYSGQAFRWARALESADPHIGARNRAEQLPGGFDFEADSLVPFATAQGSARWADAEYAAASQFTHVLVEAERPLFGRKFSRVLEDEIIALTDDGVSVAYLCHGTDIRDPARHAQRTPWSLYPEDPRTEILGQDAAANIALLKRLRRPTFVSTPDLLFDVPWAHWCPVVVDIERFCSRTEPFSAIPVRIAHASSAPMQKGSHYIPPALAPLIEAGTVDYRLITGVASAEMPAVFEATDIVIDQFRAGSYGVAACEAMASGRVVIGHVLEDVRALVEESTGMVLPIVEATPDTLTEVVRGLIAAPEEARRIGARGREFVVAVHSGSTSAQTLNDNWIAPPVTPIR